MENNIENNIFTDEKINLVQDFINKIKNKLEKETILVIDRFEGNFAICENQDTQEMISIELEKLPNQAKEGDVLKFINNKYELDYDKKNEIQNRIKEKMKNLFEE